MQHTSRAGMCKGNPEKLGECCIFHLPAASFPLAEQRLTVPQWLLSLCHVASAAVVLGVGEHSGAVSPSTPINLRIQLLLLSRGSCSGSLGWRHFVLVDSYSRDRVRKGSVQPESPRVFVVLWCRAGCMEGKRSYLALAVIILPLLNGNAFGRVFSIQLPWFVVLFWRLNVVYNQRLLQ